MVKEIIRAEGEFDLDIKRLYIPIKFRAKCPGCGEEIEVDLGSDYLAQSFINRKVPFYFYCNGCHSDLEIDVVVRVSIEVDPEEAQKQ